MDKKLIQNNFQKSLKTYNNYAIIQKQMAATLVSLIDKKKEYSSILEIGSYTGLLTKEINKKISFNNYLALDIVDSFNFIKDINPKIRFKKCDVEEFNTDEKFDLIIAGASLQWCEDFYQTVKKLKTFLSKKGVLAISIFGTKNMQEVKESFKAGLKYLSEDEIKNFFSKNALIKEENYILGFNNSKEILEHLKYTGVNSTKKLSFLEIKEGLKVLSEKFNNKLTYNPIYIID